MQDVTFLSGDKLRLMRFGLSNKSICFVGSVIYTSVIPVCSSYLFETWNRSITCMCFIRDICSSVEQQVRVVVSRFNLMRFVSCIKYRILEYVRMFESGWMVHSWPILKRCTIITQLSASPKLFPNFRSCAFKLSCVRVHMSHACYMSRPFRHP